MAKTWLITGSSRGLGASIARAALDAGENVVATARNTDSLRDFTGRYGSRVRAVALDVTDPGAAERAMKSAVDAFGRLDVVVNNAGYANIGTFEDTPADDFRAQVETNFFGVVHVTRAALPVFRAQKGGHFVQISSIGGRLGAAGLAAYQSSKWAVEGFSEVLAGEVRALGIKVTIVEPGGFRTDWAGASMRVHPPSPDYEAALAPRFAMMRKTAGAERGDPEKGAQAILRVVGESEPPLRLLLGTDALFFAGLIHDRQRAEDERWSAVARSTDFPNQPDAAQVYAKFLG